MSMASKSPMYQAYNKLEKVAGSCRTTAHWRIFRRMVVRFYAMYGGQIEKAGLPALARRIPMATALALSTERINSDAYYAALTVDRKRNRRANRK